MSLKHGDFKLLNIKLAINITLAITVPSPWEFAGLVAESEESVGPKQV